jgi:hypothetical protein
MLYVFRAGTTPELIAQAELRGAKILCDDPDVRDWLQDGVDQLVSEAGLPVSEDRLCRLRTSTRWFCSTSPLGT